MELIELMRRRRSIRKYSDEAIPEDKLTQILQAGLLAPTSRGMRPWEYYVVKDKDTLKKLSQAKQHGAALIAGCDTAIVVSADSELADTWIEDSSIALAYMDLADAHAKRRGRRRRGAERPADHGHRRPVQGRRSPGSGNSGRRKTALRS